MFNCHPITLMLQSWSYRKSRRFSYDHTVDEPGSDANRENYNTTQMTIQIKIKDRNSEC